eukprot:TRINITY_DN48698_c0_g1_i1.p1 TRINITY_DN48698_c0_g1~~TRINITY_DN48698_c0_g1_i1.p1  ORF type:complete len:578 (+),score=84.39 TRINITY_DN48698_c0_g1_i1:75-1808(+)
MAEAAAYCVDDVDTADLIALRLECLGPDDPASESGNTAQDEDVEEHYRACVDRLSNAEGRLPMRLGICCARWCEEENVWHLNSHEVALWPGNDLMMKEKVLSQRHMLAAGDLSFLMAATETAGSGEGAETAESAAVEGVDRGEDAEGGGYATGKEHNDPENSAQAGGSREAACAEAGGGADACCGPETGGADSGGKPDMGGGAEGEGTPEVGDVRDVSDAEAKGGADADVGEEDEAPGVARILQRRPPPEYSRWSEQLACCARWVVAAVLQVRVPLVFHGGLYELLQIYDLFLGRVPSNHQELGRRWLAYFPFVFDSSLMAIEGKADLAGASLVHSYRWAMDARKRGDPLPFRELGVYTRRASAARLGLISGAGEGSVAREAMAVAEMALLRLSALAKSAVPGSDDAQKPDSENGKRRKLEDGCWSTLRSSSSESASDQVPTLPQPPKTASGPSGARWMRQHPGSADRALGCAEALAAAAAKFAATGTLPRDVAGSLQICRRFQNRVSVPGTRAGSFRLDASVQAKLIKRLKRTRCRHTLDLAKFLWAAPPREAAPPMSGSSKVPNESAVRVAACAA